MIIKKSFSQERFCTWPRFKQRLAASRKWPIKKKKNIFYNSFSVANFCSKDLGITRRLEALQKNFAGFLRAV